MRPYLRQNIKQLASSFREGSLNPRLVADGSFEDAVKYRRMNAFITLTKELAYSQIDDSISRYQQKSPKSLLDGITIAIKDNFCTKDVKTTCASKMLADFIPPYNATVYERLLNAGCILIGKTNMDEFAMGSATIDSIFGPSKNIWSKSLEDDQWNIAGGSSGGSALAVASGICYASIGSDTGGSTRNPAAYCGVVGLKPTYGLVSRYGLIPLVNSMDVPGIFARNVSDCTDVLNQIAGYDFRDVTTYKKSFNPIELIQPERLTITNLRVGIPKEYYCSGLAPVVVETWQKIADLFENQGARVQEVSLPHTPYSLSVYSILNQCEVASNMARYDGIEFGHRADENSSTEKLYTKTRSEGFNDVVKTRILAGNYFLLKGNYNLYFEKALRVRRLIKNDFTNVFEKPSEGEPVDVLLTPTTLSAAPQYQSFRDASNRDLSIMQDYCTQSANMAGIPAISIPIRLSEDGLPIGLQLMSNTLNEELLLNVAQWIETQVTFNCLNNPQLSNTEQPRN